MKGLDGLVNIGVDLAIASIPSTANLPELCHNVDRVTL